MRKQLLHHDRFRAQDDTALLGNAVNSHILRLDILVEIRVHFGDEIFVRFVFRRWTTPLSFTPPPLRVQLHAWRGFGCTSAGARSGD